MAGSAAGRAEPAEEEEERGSGCCGCGGSSKPVDLDALREAGPLSRLTFAWASGLVSWCFDRELKQEMVWRLRESEKAKTCAALLRDQWEGVELNKPRGERSLTSAIFSVWGGEIALMLATKALWLALTLGTNAYALPSLIRVLSQNQTALSSSPDAISIGGGMYIDRWGLVFASLFLVFELLRSLAINSFWMRGSTLGGCRPCLSLSVSGCLTVCTFASRHRTSVSPCLALFSLL